MDLDTNIIKDKEAFYNLAINYYNNIDAEHREECLIFPKSISIVVDHDFILTPCIEIKLELRSVDEGNRIGNYFLYIDKEKDFVDEFLILK